MIDVSPVVGQALTAGDPIVALESTVIAHGLPYPRNREVALSLEAVVRDRGAVPATIGVVAGRPTVGLSEDDIERFSAAADVLKAGARDLAVASAAGRTAATTVAATSVLAARVGIRVFATGGIGGVHRGGQDSLDVSADLTELSRTPVIVVCAGAKAVLDLGRTLEALETLGVPVIGYGTGQLPSFYSRESGLELDATAGDEREVARIAAAHRALGLGSAIVVCNPPPADAELQSALVEGWIESALADAGRVGVEGKAVTPWLLGRLAELSGGRTVETNVALLESNARLAAGIAVEVAGLGRARA